MAEIGPLEQPVKDRVILSLVRKLAKSALKSAFFLQDRILKRLAQRNYQATRAYYHYKWARNDYLAKKSPIIVHQMAKVGSTSVVESLKLAKIGRPIYHTHLLMPDSLEAIERRQRHYFHTKNEPKLRHIWRSQHLQKKFRRAKEDDIWKIVTLTREPVARNISNFFQQIEVIPKEVDGTDRVVSEEYDFDIELDNDVSKLEHLFFTKYPHDNTLTYFDFEFNDFLCIDLYKGAFPTAKGFKIYEGHRAKVLLIRMENLDECAAEAFREFLGIENLRLVRRNETNQKGCAKVYQRFKESIVFPESYLDKMYESKYSQTFYDEAEIKQFRRQWLGT